MREVAVPGFQRPLHPLGIRRVPGHGAPVDVPHDDASAWSHRPPDLGQGGRRIRHVLEHLDAERRVEVLALDRHGAHLRLVESDVVPPFETAGRQGEHLRALVHADHGSLVPDVVEQLGEVEAGPAAGVENALASLGAERLADQGAAAKDVAGAVEGLELLAQALVELELAHRPPPQGLMRGRMNMCVLSLPVKAFCALFSFSQSSWGATAFGHFAPPRSLAWRCSAISAIR